MLQVARLSPKLLADSAPLVEQFIRGQMNADGGFNDSAGASDLYYTVFGLECLMALRADIPASAVVPYLQMFGEGVGLDLVHLACLARCWADVKTTAPEAASRGRPASVSSNQGCANQCGSIRFRANDARGSAPEPAR